MQEVSDSSSFASSFSLFKIRGARVLTPSGIVVGRVFGVQSNANMSKILGVRVKRGFNEIYIGREYFAQMTEESFVLNEELSVLLKGMPVLSGEGERVGYVKEVVRVKNTNNVEKLIVKGWLRPEYSLKPGQIESVGRAIILKGGVNVPKKSLWQ